MTRLEAGMPAPDFRLPDENGKLWSLDDLRGRKAIIYFYPADDTPGCTAQACDFRDARDDLEKAGYVILGVSVQGSESHRAFSSKYNLNFPLLVDENREMADAFGVRGDFGDWKGVPLRVKRSTFVIDEDGNIVRAEYGVKARGHVERLMQSLEGGGSP